MSSTRSKSFVRPTRRQQKTALLYVMRPTSTPEEPIWDLVQRLAYYEGQNFDLPIDGLRYSIMSSSGKILLDSTQAATGR
jgi:mannose/cellobiose epimerase-like protein (N-acyl-D-glucosamine 2-epimerase family)